MDGKVRRRARAMKARQAALHVTRSDLSGLLRRDGGRQACTGWRQQASKHPRSLYPSLPTALQRSNGTHLHACGEQPWRSRLLKQQAPARVGEAPPAGRTGAHRFWYENPHRVCAPTCESQEFRQSEDAAVLVCGAQAVFSWVASAIPRAAPPTSTGPPPPACDAPPSALRFLRTRQRAGLNMSNETNN